MSEFLAEAAVLVRADTTEFRAQLLSEVNAAVLAANKSVKPIVVPVAATSAAGTAAIQQQASAAAAGAASVSAALGQQAQSTTAAAAATKNLDIQSKNILATNRSLAAADKALVRARSEVLGATSAAAAATTTYSRAQTATARAEIAVERAARGSSGVQRKLAADALAAAEAFEAEALAALQSAQALNQQGAAASRAGAAQARFASGAAASALSMAGLRGAILGANSLFIAGTVAALGFGKALQSAASFQSDLNVLRVTAGATAEEMERVSATARQLGTDITLPGVGAGDAAQAMQLLARAGLSVDDSIDAARGVLQLATAAEIDNAEATQLAASALNAFGLNGNQAVKVADILANAANASQASITDMGIALQQSSAVARQVGVSLQDTATFLTILAKNGLQGSDAGTSLRVAFTRLINPTEKAQKVLSNLGVNLRDIQGNIRPQVFSDFAAAQAGLTKKQQDANAAIVFGTDALRAYSIISREGTAVFDSTAAALGRNGTAAEVAGARMTGLNGATENLKNQMSNLGIEVGELATGPMTLLVDRIADLVGGAADGVTALKRLAAAAKDAFPEAPAGLDRPGREDDPLGVAKRIFGFTNPITGVASPLGQLKLFGKLFGQEADAAGEEAKKGGAAVRDGIESAAREAAAGARSFQSEVVGALQPGFDQITTALRAGAAKVRAAAIASVARGQGQQSGLEELFDAIAPDNTSAQLANLRQQAATQARIIAAAGVDAAGVQLEARREAQSKLASINSQIKAINEQTAADAEKARNEADQRLLDGLAVGRTAASQALDRAQASETTADDIPALVAYRKRLQNEVTQVRNGVKDSKIKATELRRLSDELFQNAQQIQAAKTARNEAIKEALAEQREDLRSAAEQTGNIALLLRLLDQDIADAREVLAKAKKGTIAQAAAAEALKALQKQKRDMVNEARSDVLSDAFRIAEAQGNDSLMLQILDLQIKQAQREVGQAKTLAEKLKEQADVQELIAQRKEILEKKVEDSTKGTTAFELLTQAAQTFTGNAGNLIGADQPFAGPTGFTADLAQFLRRGRGGAAAPRPDTEMRVDRVRTSQDTSNKIMQDLIIALQQLTNVTAAASGNSSTAGLSKNAVAALGGRGAAMAAFYESRQARRGAEADNG